MEEGGKEESARVQKCERESVKSGRGVGSLTRNCGLLTANRELDARRHGFETIGDVGESRRGDGDMDVLTV